MKIGIDCRMYGLKHAGIGRYVENLARELKKSKNKEIEFVFIESDLPHYSFREQLLLPLQLIKLKLDLVHFPHFNVPIFYFGPYVVTIHDLIKHASRGMKTTTRNSFLYWLKYLGYRFVFWSAVKRAKKIIVPSKWVKRELVKQYKLDPSKVVVVYEGVSPNFQFPRPLRVAKQSGRAISNFQTNSKLKTQNSKLLKKYNIQKPFVIYTGSLYPHKNIERLIETIKNVNVSRVPPACRQGRCSVSLVIVCSRSVFSERLKKKAEELGAKRLVNFVGFVPDEDLVQIYQEAIALIQPSLMEGFDLTVVEAMAAGLPVVVSDIPVHREICDQAALYFDPENIEDMANKINQVSKSQSLRNKLQKLGFEQANKYDWQKTAWQTIKVYEEILEKN